VARFHCSCSRRNSILIGFCYSHIVSVCPADGQNLRSSVVDEDYDSPSSPIDGDIDQHNSGTSENDECGMFSCLFHMSRYTLPLYIICSVCIFLIAHLIEISTFSSSFVICSLKIENYFLNLIKTHLFLTFQILVHPQPKF
jgi:hypothetical protein